MSPRIILWNTAFLRAQASGLYEDHGGKDQFLNSFHADVNLPQQKDVYKQVGGGWEHERKLIFINSQREMEIGVGEEYKLEEKHDGKQEPIPFGVCQTKKAYLSDEEVVIFQFPFDYHSLAARYNPLAQANGWQVIESPDELIQVRTRLACHGKIIKDSDLDQKVTQHVRDQFIVEYDTFFRLLSYYLPN